MRLTRRCILDNCIPEPNSGCWLWLGTVTRGHGGKAEPYGRLTREGRHIYAHRASYRIFNGPVPNDKLVLHKCNNRLCVNPDHLKIGNDSQNNQDRYRQQRTPGGLSV